MSRGRRVTLCMGRMRKEIIGRFLQSSWASILDSTSLNAGLVALGENKTQGICSTVSRGLQTLIRSRLAIILKSMKTKNNKRSYTGKHVACFFMRMIQKKFTESQIQRIFGAKNVWNACTILFIMWISMKFLNISCTFEGNFKVCTSQNNTKKIKNLSQKFLDVNSRQMKRQF